MISITVEDKKGTVQTIEVPEGINLNLMETLKAYEYNMRATCGGMALCADCHCQVISGGERLPSPEEGELITLETRPDTASNSRLACQIKVSENINGLQIKLMGEGE
jgi:ferredoxin